MGCALSAPLSQGDSDQVRRRTISSFFTNYRQPKKERKKKRPATSSQSQQEEKKIKTTTTTTAAASHAGRDSCGFLAHDGHLLFLIAKAFSISSYYEEKGINA